MWQIGINNHHSYMTRGEGVHKRGSECFADCIDRSEQGDTISLLPLVPSLQSLKKNYQVIPIHDRYILKNTRYTALLDEEAFRFLETFGSQPMPQELLETLYRLEFLADATH